MTIVPEPPPDSPSPPRPAQMCFAVLDSDTRAQESVPVYGTGDPQLDRDLARIATRLRAKGGL